MSHPPEIPSSETLCLATGYRQQETIESHDDFSSEPYWSDQRIAASGIYQQHVYRWASSLIRKSSYSSVLDVGCGPGTKLARWVRPHCEAVVGADLESAVTIAQSLHASIHFQVADLDQPGTLGARKFDLIICADVIEHLADPRVLIQSILAVSHPKTQILISTPDRDRLRGRRSMSSPMKEHIREWTSSELDRFLRQEGLDIQSSRLLPFGDGSLALTALRDVVFRCRLTDRSPLRCYTVLCTPAELSS